jgi:hypothetical protein
MDFHKTCHEFHEFLEFLEFFFVHCQSMALALSYGKKEDEERIIRWLISCNSCNSWPGLWV